MNEPTIVIEEVLGRAQQGVTHPFICRGDDGFVYYVKGAGAGRRSQVCEWVAAQLARAFELPVADYALAEVPSELIELQVRADIGQLGAGVVFASRELPHVQELSVTTRELVPSETAMDVLVFDWWVRNEDRSLTKRGGNPNLLWDFQSDELVVIDHNQAFDRSFNVDHFLDAHVFSDYWNYVYSDHVERRKYQERMKSVLDGLDVVRDTIPSSWWYVDVGVPADVTWDEIVRCLERYRQQDFWNTP